MQTFAQRLRLQNADVLVVPKSSWNIVKHLIIFWGHDVTGTDFYLENNPLYGVRWLTGEELRKEYPIVQAIRKFAGTEGQRALAIQRAESQLGIAYNLTTYNCEHFANYVQHGFFYSKQANTGIALAFSAIGLALISYGINTRK